ncbi:MAG: hypothetical protein DWQ47_05160 [Acidobacteria bacterium]|nr:MAG: hypothetical protein DWQ32_08710 [Acidobacteriota bacterium]REK01772.1 MAG: hypothetical protein DWQ38_05145 [Acidobacteriota bacterium]REK14728.1 MAG: hypothetical protein DWQ43_14400 [Acidobacteriota bacterium]REK45443.1 MAG: hypothetical protein DWQ47_05160 [Acidobacteriota bacterium]
MAEEKPKNELLIKAVFAAIIAAAAFVAFSPSLSGDFVYDDNRQIVRNTLIQNPDLYWQALTSDVWAFKGDGTVTASNYWRPVFTAWSIILFSLFGLDPFGWHLASLILHAFVSVLVFLLLERLEFGGAAAFAIALIFAVHPVHTESVAWIAGSPDLLFSAFLVGALLLAQIARTRMSAWRFIASLLLYLLALGSKEVAMLTFPLFGLLFFRSDESTNLTKSLRSIFVDSAPYFGLATLFFAVRWIVLGAVSRDIPGAPSVREAIYSFPEVLNFYFKQASGLYPLAANHRLRPVTEISFDSFIFPMLAVVGFVVIVWFLARRSPYRYFLLAILILPLLPALNITAFSPEEIVHGRYLYLPVLGFIAALVLGGGQLFENLFKQTAGAVLITAAAIVSAGYLLKSYSNSSVWMTDIKLWQHTVSVDPNSAKNFVQYGSALESKERYAEAARAYGRSLEVAPTALGYLGKGRSQLRLGNYEEAAASLRSVTAMPDDEVNAYTLYQAYEALAIALSSSGKLGEASQVLEEASKRLRVYEAALASKRSVVLYQQDKKAEALALLESMRERAKTELLPESKSVIYRLGALYAEMGRKEDARNALDEYLSLTKSIADENTLEDRKRAEELLKSIN